MICRRKKGNTILLIMVVAMVILIMSSAVTSAILFTSKSNRKEKIESDLLYAAEGGSELGISLIRQNISYGDSVSNVAIQNEINSKASVLGDTSVPAVRNTMVYSVDVSTEVLVAGKRIKVTSTAYARDSSGHKDINNKKTVEKIIAKTGQATSAKIFENSLVAQDDINVSGIGTADMGTTQINGGGSINVSHPTSLVPIEKNDRIESAIFKNNVSKVNSVVNYNRIAISVSSTALLNTGVGITLAPDGSTIIGNGTAKDTLGNIIPGNGIGLLHVGTYDIILVNADKLIIEPELLSSLADTKKIVICSGDIEIKLAVTTNDLTWCTFFGENVNINVTSSLKVVSSPASNPPSGFDLTSSELDYIDLVLSKYIKNWNLSTSVPVDKWQIIDSQTIYS